MYLRPPVEQSFLHTCISLLVERHGTALGDVCIVVPNRRAKLFIRNSIAASAKVPVWAPDIFAQDDFMAHLSGYTVADRLTQLFYFYEVYKGMAGEDARAFADFIHWAPTLLADFNEVDQYMADAEALFTYLNEAKAIDNWNLGRTELTDFQKRYLEFWKQMKGFYNGLNQRLADDGLAYQGMAYRKAADNIEQTAAALPWKKVYFMGFNALTKAEELVIKHLTKYQLAEVFWDTDSFYLDNDKHEAGKFLRRYRNMFADTFGEASQLLEDPTKEIEIIGVSGNAAQAKLAGKLVEDLSAQRNYNVTGTALVLADETLLLPVLNSLPQNVHEVNVTMGYPIKYTPLASFIDAVFSLHINSLKYSEGRSELRYYHKDITNVIGHPLFNLLVGATVNPLEATYTISKNNYVFLNYKLIETLLTDEVAATIITRRQAIESIGNDGIIGFVGHLETLVKTLRDKLLAQGDSAPAAELTLEYLYTYYRYLQKLKTLLAGKPLVADLQTLRQLFNQLISNATLPFYGEPLKGLQVMGMLETRTLDFENIVLLSVNEGTLPQGKAGHSFIPHEVKKYFELPTYADRDAIFSYHFYRLLQRAKKVWILYNSQSEAGIGSKERSRFITQLVNELKGPKIIERVLEIPPGGASENTINFEKTPEVLNKLKMLGERGFSPSAMAMFIRCPLQFYFRYIAGLKENEVVEETLEADTMGTLVHSILEGLFKPHLGKVLKTEDIELMQQQAPGFTEAAFQKEFGTDNYLLGKNLLIYRVSKRFIENFLVFQKETLTADVAKGYDTIVMELERAMLAPLAIDNGMVNIAGNADRIDHTGNAIRIIDYKTGKVDPRELSFAEWPDLLEHTDYAKSFQLLTYAWLYYQNTHAAEQLKPSIVAFTKLSEGYIECKTPLGAGYITPEDLDEFEGVLKTLINRLFSTGETFYQTPEKENCRYCVYNSICNRN